LVYTLSGGRGSQYQRHLHKPGDIVRWRDKWGVCEGFQFADVPRWAFYDEDGEFIDRISSADNDISAPYDHTYVGIPDAVLAKATAYKLTENL
jgi:hypothetical protein